MWKVKYKHNRADGGIAAVELESEDGRMDVNARWDGCMEIHLYTVTEENRELKDTIHTCDLRGLIESLGSLDSVIRDYFEENNSSL
ncbi:hypothetical protein [Peribacillus deserti]|uniref:Uncharacterized protein n=1 Tax=Peribacillus deserti TaxID=673318 RepID=A0A2N5M7Z3_9BACI|nr:hypothetical protein [Peribacillus deserti]PLT30452.1 hypothetical protein CUU66_07255 [Peribacillus deserti]